MFLAIGFSLLLSHKEFSQSNKSKPCIKCLILRELTCYHAISTFMHTVCALETWNNIQQHVLRSCNPIVFQGPRISQSQNLDRPPHTGNNHNYLSAGLLKTKNMVMKILT